MKYYYLFELKAFISNKKNIAVVILMLIATLYYSIFIAPDYSPNERINESEIVREYDEMVHWLENRKGEGISSGAAFALQYFPPLVEINGRRLAALEINNFYAYTSASAEWYEYQDEWTFNFPEFLSYNRVYYGVDQNYPKQEGRYWYLETANRYSAYVNQEIELSPSIIEERTALQTGNRILSNQFVPFILIGLVVIFSNDIVLKDRNHLSIVKSFPISINGKLWIKTAVTFTAVSMVVISLFLIGFTIIGIKEGFGHFSIPVSVFNGPILSVDNFSTVSIGVFYLKVLVLFFLIAYSFIRLIILCSLLFKNEFFNLLVGSALIFTERIYYMRGIGYFSNLDILPFTFFPVGYVLTGYQNHLYNSSMITFTNGILSIISILLCIEIMIFIICRKSTIRRFI